MTENVQRTTDSASKDEEALRRREKLVLFVAKQTQPEGGRWCQRQRPQVKTTQSTVRARWQASTLRPCEPANLECELKTPEVDGRSWNANSLTGSRLKVDLRKTKTLPCETTCSGFTCSSASRWLAAGRFRSYRLTSVVSLRGACPPYGRLTGK